MSHRCNLPKTLDIGRLHKNYCNWGYSTVKTEFGPSLAQLHNFFVCLQAKFGKQIFDLVLKF